MSYPRSPTSLASSALYSNASGIRPRCMTLPKQMITSRSRRPLSKLFMTKHAGRVVSSTGWLFICQQRESRCVKCALTTEWATQRPSKSGYAQTKGSQRPWARSPTRGKRTRQFALDRSGMIALGGSHPIGPRHQAPGDGRIGSQPGVSGREPGASGQVQFVFLFLSIAPVARSTFLATLCRFFSLVECTFSRSACAKSSPCISSCAQWLISTRYLLQPCSCHSGTF